MTHAGHRKVYYACGKHVKEQCRCMGQKPERVSKHPCPICKEAPETGCQHPCELASDFTPTVPWRDPEPTELETPEFRAVWAAIKSWDINVPEAYEGYCGATGNHVVAILDALKAAK